MREVMVRHFFRWIARLMVCAVAAALAAGCTGRAEHPRIPPDDSGFGAAILPNRKDDSPYPVVGIIGLCIDRPGTVEVIDVALEHSEGGLRLDNFALTPKTG